MATSLSPIALFVTGLGTGLVAGGTSCAAVQGGLLAGAVTRRTGSAEMPPGRPALAAARPVALFLAGKLISHTALGGLLGAAGALLQPSPQARAVLLIAAGAVIAVFALELMGVRALARWSPRPPVSLLRLLRRGSRSGLPSAPALLGLATVALPCGITLSMELTASTSGSVAGGAAVMAGFVLGTAPLFTVLGVLLRHSMRIWRGRLRIATGVLVAAVSVWTVISGLRAGGWIAPPGGPEPARPAVPVAAPSAPAGPAARQTITLRVRDDAYTPSRVRARAGVATTLVLHTRGASGCTRAFTIPARGLQRILPKTGDTAIDLGAPRPGRLRYSCAMGMAGGVIDFTAAGPAEPPASAPAP